MKRNKLILSCKLLTLLLLSTVTLSSCDKDDVDAPAFVGTWQNEQEGVDLTLKLKTSVIAIHSRDVLTLEKNSYVKTYEHKYTTFGWVVIDGEKGAISEANGILTVTQKQKSEFVDESNASLGVTYIDIQPPLPDSFKAKWSVIGNKLTIITDGNNDGDFEDVDESDDYQMVYTRQ